MSEQVSLEDVAVELPPHIEQFLGKLKAARKKLMKDDAFADPKQMRLFLGMYLYPQLINGIELLAAATFDVYGLAVSNSNSIRRLHAFTVAELQDIGADLDDAPLPGVSPEVMDEFQQAFYALAVVVKEKLPGDKEAQAAWNRCAELLSEMVSELMGDSSDDDRDDRDDDEDDEDDDDEEEKAQKKKSKAEPKAEAKPSAEPDETSDSPDETPAEEKSP